MIPLSLRHSGEMSPDPQELPFIAKKRGLSRVDIPAHLALELEDSATAIDPDRPAIPPGGEDGILECRFGIPEPQVRMLAQGIREAKTGSPVAGANLVVVHEFM
jgi:hypothetical protein